jgi:death on curing protein
MQISTGVLRNSLNRQNAGVFLRLNGYLFEEDPIAAYDFMIGLFEHGDFRFEKLEPWLRANSRSR